MKQSAHENRSDTELGAQNRYDVIVIGGGPSGMMAAGTAGARGKRVLLLEKNRELGRKLALTGNGRCNILNAEEDIHALLAHYGEASKFLYSTFSKHGMRDSWEFFERQGLSLIVEERKRAFPKSQKATDVTYTLERYMTEQGVEILCGTEVLGFTMENDKIVGVRTTKGTFVAGSYVLATGGLSRPETGSTGDGFKWLRKLGYIIHTPNPDIVPLVVSDDWVKKLSGTTLAEMKITFGVDLTKAEGKFSRIGGLLFTRFGLSGPLILNSARLVKKLLIERKSVRAEIDMFPNIEIGTLRERILALCELNKNKTFKNILSQLVPDGMDKALFELVPREILERKVHSINREERHAVVDMVKAMPVHITGTLGMGHAVVSDGGIDLAQVDMKTMQSKLHANVFVTGDMLNVSRPSGGFSLQLCWTTGYVAGASA